MPSKTFASISDTQHMRCCKPTIVLVIGQVTKFHEKGLKCTHIGEDQDDTAVKAAVFAGKHQLAYMNPESLLCVLQWRETFDQESTR